MWRSFATLLALLLAARTSRASEIYPDVMRATVPTNQPLPCTLCHALADGGDGAVTTVFGRHMLEFGMTGSDSASLQRALRRNAARGWDSDGDGVTDVEELVYGTDPSSSALSSGPPLAHGCAVRSLVPTSHIASLFIALGVWRLWKTRRRGDPRR
jgi:Bacterial TSP3 repeat